DLYNYYSVDRAELQLVQYEKHFERDYLELARYTYELPIAVVDAGEGYLKQVSSDDGYSLSIYDLLDHRNPLEEIWMRELPVQITSITEGDRFEFEEWNQSHEAS